LNLGVLFDPGCQVAGFSDKIMLKIEDDSASELSSAPTRIARHKDNGPPIVPDPDDRRERLYSIFPGCVFPCDKFAEIGSFT
jgi:hypothetical protein